ncbi:YgaP-like transmembrane domain [Chromatium okenii]
MCVLRRCSSDLFGLITHDWLGLLGLVLVGTAYLRSCPAYTLINFDTNKK